MSHSTVCRGDHTYVHHSFSFLNTLKFEFIKIKEITDKLVQTKQHRVHHKSLVDVGVTLQVK